MLSRPYTGPDICDKHGQTTLTIQDLKKEVLDMLEDEQTKKLWFSQVCLCARWIANDHVRSMVSHAIAISQ